MASQVRAAEITQDWDPDNQTGLPTNLEHPFFRVTNGTEGWIHATGHGFCLFEPIDDPDKQGLIPETILKKGLKNKTPLPIVQPLRTESASASTYPRRANNVLHQMLRDLWEIIGENREQIVSSLPGMSPGAMSAMFAFDAHTYADVIYDSITREARDIMQNGVFDPVSLAGLRPVGAQWPTNPGIYVIVYQRIPDGQSYTSAMYWGQSSNMQNRNQMHQRATQEGNRRSRHYIVARQAEQRTMIPIIIPPIAGVSPHILDVAEFTMVCLFRSWYPMLTTPAHINLIGSYGLDFEAASLFNSLARRAAERTNWKPTIRQGLNWNTPIVRNGHPLTKWVAWYSHKDKCYVYRARRVIEYNTKTKCTSFRHASTFHITIPEELQKQIRLPHGHIVHVVVEIHSDQNSNFRPHPFRFVRLPPNVGRNHELEQLKAMAIRIEWCAAGSTEWQCAYLERSKIWTGLSDQNAEVLGMYRTGMMLWMDLLQIDYNNRPDWMPHRRPVIVEFLEYDHMRQTLTPTVVQSEARNWPQDRTIQENGNRLRETFPSNRFPEIHIGNRPAKMPKQRKACDICLSQISTATCDYDASAGTCQCCRLLNRPCTFTIHPQGLDRMLQGRDLEELGIPANLTRWDGAQDALLEHGSFNPDLDSEEHTVQDLVPGGSGDAASGAGPSGS